MNYGTMLPRTGAVVAVGGLSIWQWGWIAVATGAVLFAAATIRFGWRRRRSVSQP